MFKSLGQFVGLGAIKMAFNCWTHQQTTTPPSFIVCGLHWNPPSLLYWVSNYQLKGFHRGVWSLLEHVTLKRPVLSFIICLQERAAGAQPQNKKELVYRRSQAKQPRYGGTDPLSVQSRREVVSTRCSGPTYIKRAIFVLALNLQRDEEEVRSRQILSIDSWESAKSSPFWFFFFFAKMAQSIGLISVGMSLFSFFTQGRAVRWLSSASSSWTPCGLRAERPSA